MMDDDYSDILNTDPERLGLGGYCFLACTLLTNLHPTAEVWRLTDGESFRHVFLKVSGEPLDIKGFRSVSAMKTDLEDEAVWEEKTDVDAVRRYFYGFTEAGERKAARKVLADFIDGHISKFVNGQVDDQD